MDLNKLKYFYEVALTGNYKAAGEKLGKTSAAIGIAVRDLEKELGCSFFRRTYRGLTLTKEGNLLFEAAVKIMKESLLVEDALQLQSNILKRLRILATVGITSDWVPRFIPAFLEKHPEVNLEISSLTSMAAFELYQYDIYIGEIFKKDPKYVYKTLKNFRYRFYASREYIEKHGYPEKVEDLKTHRLIEFNIRRVSGFYKSTDLFEAINREDLKKISIDSTIGEYKLATEGAGIACLCEELSFLRDSSLFGVLGECGPIEVQIYFVFHESLRGNKIVMSLFNKIKESSRIHSKHNISWPKEHGKRI